MKKKVFGRKLSRERSSREALFVSLVESLVMNKKIKTTKAKAKAIVGLVDRLIVLAKKDTLSSKREIAKRLRGNKKVATVLWNEFPKMFESRNSGFTRIIPLGQRKGDLAEMVRLEFVESKKEDEKNVSTKEK